MKAVRELWAMRADDAGQSERARARADAYREAAALLDEHGHRGWVALLTIVSERLGAQVSRLDTGDLVERGRTVYRAQAWAVIVGDVRRQVVTEMVEATFNHGPADGRLLRTARRAQ